MIKLNKQAEKTQLNNEVLKGVAEFGLEVSGEDLDIIMGDVENWLTFTDCTIGEAITHALNYEDPWNDQYKCFM